MPKRRRYRPKDAVTRVQDAIFGDLKSISQAAAKKLGILGNTPDADRVDDEDYHQHIRDNWATPGFAKKLAERYMGPIKGPNDFVPADKLKQFEEDVIAAFAPLGGYQPPPPPPPMNPLLGGAGGAAPPPPVPGPVAAGPGGPPPLPPEGMVSGESGLDPFGAAAVGGIPLPPPPPGAFGGAPPAGPGTLPPEG
jgi:hypothetical protein